MVGKLAHQTLVLELDKTKEHVEQFLDMMKISTRDEDRARFREFFTAISDDMTRNYIVNTKPVEDLDVEKKEIRQVFKPLNSEFTRRFQNRVNELCERLTILEQKRTSLHQLMRTQVEPRLNKCTDAALNPDVNILARMANGRTRPMDFEEFIDLRLKSYYADIAETGNRLEILQSSFDSLKKEAENSLRGLQVRTHNLESVHKLDFEQLEEYEKILQEHNEDYEALVRGRQDTLASLRFG